MGCKKVDWIIFGRKASQIKKTLIVPLVVVMMITAVTPIVFAANEHSDTITVTFDPGGDIELDVTPGTATFGTVDFEASNEWPSEGGLDTTYTLYNNGSVAADVWIKANHTTDSGNMDLENTGNPAQDQYCLNVTGSNAQQITNTNASWSNNLAGGGATITFGINLELGTGSEDWAAQTTTINITGVIHT